MPKKDEYGNESISMLKGADRVRLRPAVIFGSDNLEGCIHSFFEILSNSIDEAREGYGDRINITRFPDGTIEVEDFGRGIPLDYNVKEQRYNWELVYCELYAGGKYNNNASGDYEYSLGLNGLGACATQYASEFFDVTVMRDKTKYHISFKKGEAATELISEPYKFRRTGTIQRWKPDSEVFTETVIPLETFQEIIKRQSVINSGIEFVLKDSESGQEFSYSYPEGIRAYVDELSDMKGFTDSFFFTGEGKGRDKADRDEYKVKAEVAFCFNNENNYLEYFHNSSFLEYGGSPDKAVKSAFVSEVDRQIKLRDKYKANESKIVFQDVADSLILVTNTFSTQTSYENQTKKAINNKFIQEYMTSLIRDNLEVWFTEFKEAGDKVVDQILVNKRSRENAEKTRINIKKKLMGTLDINNRIKKFVDCRTRDVDRRELYIVEGDSALGSVKLGRDAEFQAVMPVRGKILNCLKADYNAIFNSEIITDLLKVLGCGVEISNKHNKDLSAFNLENLRWNKIIICTDADVDGFQIRTLILAMIYRLTPTLIEKGFVYIAESPLFEITYRPKGKNAQEQTLFAFNEKEKTEILAGIDQKLCSIQRSKGLGENEPEMMWQTTMNPKSRRLIKVCPEEARKTSEIFELLLGDNLQGRKLHIEQDGHLYLDMLDIG
ncbi:MAG: toprim domain-containing protein [Saccharofermentans sp.]|jgi:DNA gyrase subunit B|nr:toprim domain-containing protein [Mageeibacillus sp.]MCI1263671.1 toprim domain-containing protein [Saccharofermentans sp.]MCI1274704.1 toprim domain-containing protein [Saccharofermentans sp.]MCI1769873.1 toprim domain-containing protein [Mageeibacillus sp.]MCI2043683.1 toprim domain-containing protein [Mageeibacillus sp.]